MINRSYDINPVRIFPGIDGLTPPNDRDGNGKGNGPRKKNKKQKSDEISEKKIDEDIDLGEDDEHFIDYSV